MKKGIKQAYLLLPLKKQLFQLIKAVVSLPPSIYQHLYFKGFFKVKVNETTSFMLYHPAQIEENQIFWKGLKGGWEKKSVALWQQLCVDAKVIFDIGANTGLYSLVAASINPKAKIYSFEPLPFVNRYFKRNITRNQFQINNYEIALSDYKGIATVYLPKGADFSYSVTVNKSLLDQETEQEELTIQTSTLQSFIEENKIPQIDLMKIDVETHEPEVLEGMGKYLQKFQPTLIIEVLNMECAEKLNSIISGMNYCIFNIDDTSNSIRRIQKIEPSDQWNLLLCKKEIAEKLNLI